GAGPAATGRVAQRMADFGLRLFREAVGRRGDANAVFAPHGAAAVLVALQVATAGQGRRQLEVAMGFGVDGEGPRGPCR
ncbi:PAI1 inhibitor, partial [Steatornis caripensis]|nr:PAI1 inhibitor [Steatornis caripensis]